MDLQRVTSDSDTDTDVDIPQQKFLPRAITAPKQPYPAPPTQPIYKECLKNHGVTLGTFILDGCGEFMLLKTDPSLLCAVCGCHRNFHRKININNNSLESSPWASPPYHAPPLYPVGANSQHQTSTKTGEAYPAPSNYHASLHDPKLMELSAAAIAAPVEEVSRPKKRFRTKFTKEQKDEMIAFARKQGWKIPKANEDSVEEFCNKIGVTKRVFKIWMQNNKCTVNK